MKDVEGGRAGNLPPFLVFLAIPLLVTFPLLLHPFSRVAGDINNYDLSGHIWKLWWFRYALSHGISPFYCTFDYFPTGTDLLVSLGGFMDILFALPILFILPPSFIFNLFTLSLLFLNGYAAFLLARRLTGTRDFSILAGLIASVNPFVLREVYAGRVEEYSTFPTLLFLLFFVKTLDEEGRMNPLLAGLFFSLSSLSFLFYPIMNSLFALFFLIFHLFGKGPSLETAKRLGIAVITASLLSLPYFTKFTVNLENTPWGGGIWGEKFPGLGEIIEMESGKDPEIGVEGGKDPESEGRGIFSRVTSAFIVNRSVPLDISKMGEVAPFLLFLLLPLSSLFFRDSRRINLPLILLALFSLLLSLGPFLRLNERVVWNLGGRTSYLPLPYILFHDYFPFFYMNRFPSRFFQFFLIFSGIAWSGAGERLYRCLHPRRVSRGLFIFILSALYMAGLKAYLSLPVHETTDRERMERSRSLPAHLSRLPEAHRFYRDLRGSVEEGVVINIPESILLARDAPPDFYYQTVHERPLLAGMGTSSVHYDEFSYQNSFVRNLRAWQISLPMKGDEGYIDPLDIELLREMGFRFIVVNDSIHAIARSEYIMRALNHLFGPPLRDSSAIPPITVFDMKRYPARLECQGLAFMIEDDGDLVCRDSLPVKGGMEKKETIRSLMEEGRWNDALRLIRGLKGDEIDDEVTFLEGRIYYEKRMVKEALERFISSKDLIEEDPVKGEYLSKIARMWCRTWTIDRGVCSRIDE